MSDDLRSLNYDEIKNLVKKYNAADFRAGQIYSWIHQKDIMDISEMTNVPKSLRDNITEDYSLYNCTIEKKLVSEYNDTVKYLYKLHDGEYIESVVMKYKYGYTVCISTQVGCKMRCAFCASALNGWSRNLTPGEMLAEVYTAQRNLSVNVSHIVLMGMGEPLDNYDNVMKFLDMVTDEKGRNISARHISVSTCGIVPKIIELADKKPQFTLSISLHAPNDNIRSKIMPINKTYNTDELLKACRYYTQKTSRRISFEYAMILGVNDTKACAVELADKLHGMLCHVNLIPANPVTENSFEKSTDKNIKEFSDILSAKGITVTVRRSLGSDINASCGQLRRKTINGEA